MKLLPINKIKGNPSNPRLIKNDKYRQQLKSIKDTPQMMNLRPVIIDEDNVILGGHMRWRACRELGWKEIPTESYTEAIHKTTKSWTEDKKTYEELCREITIKDNTHYGEYDFDILANEWDDLPLNDWGLDVWEPEDDESEGLTDEDDVPEAPQEPITKLGDVWILGEHRVMCGDSTSKEAVEILMDGDISELLFTSPPYSDMREYNGGKDLSIGNLINFIATYYPFAKYQAVNLGMQIKERVVVPYWNDYIEKAQDCGYVLMGWNVWHKTAVNVGQQKQFFPCYHEWVFVFGTDAKPLNKTIKKKTGANPSILSTGRRQKDGSIKRSSKGDQSSPFKMMESVFQSNPELGTIRKHHPATFPVELPEAYIKAMTQENDVISEPFLGSGTTLIACEKTNRKCYGMELDPKYCDVIVKRWEDFTGKKATREIDDLEVMTQAH